MTNKTEGELENCAHCGRLPRLRKDNEGHAIVTNCRPSCILFGEVFGWYEYENIALIRWNTRHNQTQGIDLEEVKNALHRIGSMRGDGTDELVNDMANCALEALALFPTQPENSMTVETPNNHTQDDLSVLGDTQTGKSD